MEKTVSLKLCHFLSSAGVASRRKCIDIIKIGRVKINGQTVTAPGCVVNVGDEVICDGHRVQVEQRRYIMLNKPRGYVCSSSDPHAGKLALDLVRLNGAARLFSAGRLDKNSEGLLIITNDGDYAMRLTHPRYEIFKEYTVQTDSALPPSELERLRHGIMDNGEWLLPQRIETIAGNGYRFILNEGKKREIRRLIAAAGRKTVTLRRVAVGALRLDGLKSGQWRVLSENEVALSLQPGLAPPDKG